MPQIIEAPDDGEERRRYQDEATTAPLRPVIQPRRGRTGLFAALWSGMTTWLTRSAQSHRAYTTQPFELIVNHIARKQPYLYIEGLSG